MIIINKNEGPKIPYSVRNKKITFDDDLTINLVKRERDDPVHIDICMDIYDELVIGAAAGRRYVAEIDIPARQYEYPETVTVGEELNEPSGEGGEFPDEGEAPVPIPLDMDTVTLSLWALEEE